MTDNKKNLIVVSETTKSRLVSHKHPGQTFDGIIEELLNTIEALEKQPADTPKSERRM